MHILMVFDGTFRYSNVLLCNIYYNNKFPAENVTKKFNKKNL